MSILVCGDQMIDRYLWGDVTRISPEAPVPIAKIERIEERAGGAANVLANVQSLGAEVESILSIGEGPVVKIRIIGKNQQMLRVDFDTPQTPFTYESLAGAAKRNRIVIFSDYGKGSLANIQELIAACTAWG